MVVLFWLLAGVIFYTYFGYPLLILLISLFVNKKVRKADIEPNVTVLITAHNEERAIKEKILDTLTLDYPKEKLEVLVASDSSTDNTDNFVNEFQERGVKLFRVDGRVGKTETQNQAVKTANGEIIIFSDATTRYEKSAIRKIVRNYADSRVGAVSGRYNYFDKNKTQIGRGVITFWDYENFIKMRQTKIRTITGCCGCIYSVRKQLYVSLPQDIISDLVEPLKILEQGYRIVFEPEALAYESACQRSEEEFKMRVRVISRGMQGLLYMKRLFNPFKYGFVSFQLISHKVLRWLIPLFLLLLYITNIFLIGQGSFYRVTFLLQSLFFIFALLGFLVDFLPRKINPRLSRTKFRGLSGVDTEMLSSPSSCSERKRGIRAWFSSGECTKIFSFPLYFCVVNIASVIALIKTAMKEKNVIWQTVR